VSARDTILSAIDATLGPRPEQASIDAKAQALLLDLDETRPALPLHHIAVLHARDILPHLKDLAPAPAALPRNLNLVTGASGTTDIEGSYVRGAHGPRHPHIVLIKE